MIEWLPVDLQSNAGRVLNFHKLGGREVGNCSHALTVCQVKSVLNTVDSIMLCTQNAVLWHLYWQHKCMIHISLYIIGLQNICTTTRTQNRSSVVFLFCFFLLFFLSNFCTLHNLRISEWKPFCIVFRHGMSARRWPCQPLSCMFFFTHCTHDLRLAHIPYMSERCLSLVVIRA